MKFVPQIRGGRDMHHWLRKLRLDLLPPARCCRGSCAVARVFATGMCRAALDSGQLTQRPMFEAFDGDQVVWKDGKREHVDAIIFGPGYRLPPQPAVSPRPWRRG